MSEKIIEMELDGKEIPKKYIDWFNDYIEVIIKKKDEEIKKLKSELEETEEEKNKILLYQKETFEKLLGETCERNIQLVGKLAEKIDSLETNQNQKAIECLKDVLNHFTNRPTWFDYARLEYKISEQDKKFIDYVENKIKELEGNND